MTALLEAKGLEAGYGLVQVLRGLDFHVDEGEVVVILGANGAGKTTTIRAVTGMIQAKGLVAVDGRSVVGKRPEDIVRRGLAHVPQGRGTFVDLTVEENLRLGAYVRKDGEIDADIERWYETFPRLAERRTAGCRIDERRRAADARHRPRPHGQAAAAHARRAVPRPRTDRDPASSSPSSGS